MAWSYVESAQPLEVGEGVGIGAAEVVGGVTEVVGTQAKVEPRQVRRKDPLPAEMEVSKQVSANSAVLQRKVQITPRLQSAPTLV